MKLIVSEKVIAGRRIADILSKGKFDERKERGIPIWAFDKGETVLVPLNGHFINVDFPKKYAFWTLGGLEELVDKVPIEYKVSSEGIAAALKKYGKKATELVVCTDADREGESIGLEAINVVREVNPKIKITRAKFSAITPKEVLPAFASLEKFDFALADSADSRREIDLVWGAILTRFVSIVSKRRGRAFLSV
ncbi:MAG: DNA topoisomerase I, partial [Candidatus Diapherotrites archaeon]|nr:DNA topoisomerase I [Candidatus Diapherotrites archaeon]